MFVKCIRLGLQVSSCFLPQASIIQLDFVTEIITLLYFFSQFKVLTLWYFIPLKRVKKKKLSKLIFQVKMNIFDVNLWN